jgi:hypothetical protein
MVLTAVFYSFINSCKKFENKKILQLCAPGYNRSQSGPWLGLCSNDREPCRPGTYGDPPRKPCEPCPCPLTNPGKQWVLIICMINERRDAEISGTRCYECMIDFQVPVILTHLTKTVRLGHMLLFQECFLFRAVFYEEEFGDIILFMYLRKVRLFSEGHIYYVML